MTTKSAQSSDLKMAQTIMKDTISPQIKQTYGNGWHALGPALQRCIVQAHAFTFINGPIANMFEPEKVTEIARALHGYINVTYPEA